MTLAFLIFAAFWVLAWIVLLVVGAVNVIFRPLLEDEVRDEWDVVDDAEAAKRQAAA